MPSRFSVGIPSLARWRSTELPPPCTTMTDPGRAVCSAQIESIVAESAAESSRSAPPSLTTKSER